jgi:hypothetical protein
MMLRNLYWGISLALVAGKAAADVFKHQEHAPHGQRCDCYTNCVSCIYETLRRQQRREYSLQDFLRRTE